ncbi:hypothetical protein NP233_g11149 [Leucocoprinus birnbaumii]|uniref:Uncharacterized protein n=1 Tax=Leucocoprinus birnbaumii TaxID=56174 RepID=A0AAD5VHL4_9AGAR|nr:hypothetical protein NP233_g11149 [Leucocoprinus birnbaumii]
MLTHIKTTLIVTCFSQNVLSIEIDFGQSSESRSQKLVPWKFFGKNKLIIESFIIWWIERKSATKLTVRCIKDFPHHLVNGAHCLYLDASTFDKDSVAARASPRTAFLSLYDCQQVLHLYESRKILFNSLTSLFINVSNAKELDKVNCSWNTPLIPSARLGWISAILIVSSLSLLYNSLPILTDLPPHRSQILSDKAAHFGSLPPPTLPPDRV